MGLPGTARALGTPRVLWAGLSGSTVMMAIVGAVIPSPPHGNGAPLGSMTLLFAGVSVANAVLSFVLPARTYERALAAIRVEVEPEPEAGFEGGFRQGASSSNRFANPAKALRSALGAFQTAFILSLALSESVALFGFALSRLGAPLTTAAPFFVVAWVLMGVRYPTHARAFGRFEARFGARL